MSIVVTNPENHSTRSTLEIPSEGLHAARLLKVKDLGQIESRFGLQHRVRFIFEVLDESDSNGKNKLAFSSYNLSLNHKSLLFKAVKSLLGEEPPATLDLEMLVGIECQVLIEHNQANGITYANIVGIIRQQGVR